MGATSAQVQAGEAAVKVRADHQKLGTDLAKAEALVKNFAGSVNRFGDQVGKKFGGKMTEGIVTFMGVQAADKILRALADNMDAAARGEDFKGIGMVIGESIAAGLESVPIAGSVGRILSHGFAYLGGVDLGAEERIAKSREEAAKRQQAVGQVDSALRAMQFDRASGGDALLAKRESFEKDVEGKINAMLAAGVPLEEARQSVQGLREEFDRLMAGEAQAKLDELLGKYRQFGGMMTEADVAAAKLKEEMQAVERAYAAAGMAQQGMLEAARLADVAKFAEQGKRDQEALAKYDDERKRRLEEIQSVIDGLNESLIEAQLNGDEIATTTRRLESLGASKDQIDAAVYAIQLRRFFEVDEFNSGFVPPDPGEVSRTVFGSFAAGAAASVGQAVTFDKLEDLNQQIARNTERTADAVQNMKPVFGA